MHVTKMGREMEHVNREKKQSSIKFDKYLQDAVHRRAKTIQLVDEEALQRMAATEARFRAT